MIGLVSRPIGAMGNAPSTRDPCHLPKAGIELARQELEVLQKKDRMTADLVFRDLSLGLSGAGGHLQRV